MKSEFISRKEGNRNLILIFAGWSTQATFYSGIEISGWDVMVCHSYDTLIFDNEALKAYSTVFLFAWSLGVAAAERSIDPMLVTSAFAINGSHIPVNDEYGIPIEIYNGTTENLSPRNLLKFQKRMAGGSENFSRYFNGLSSQIDDMYIKDLKAQLLTFRDLIPMNGNKCHLPWKRAYIGLKDRIFPPGNMLRAWKDFSNAVIIECNENHLPDIKKIIYSTIPDKKEICRSFASASESYDANARAQQLIAQRLTEFTLKTGFRKNAKILEIGSGTGLFSRLYAPVLEPQSIDYVDIASKFEGGLAPEEHFYISDAEEWMEETHNKWDAILSASTIQWFSNPDKFFINCARTLHKDGILSFSTFLPGNLQELDKFRPAPLHYHSKNEIIEMLTNDFDEIKTIQEEIELSFSSSRELLMHLKYTGVTGTAPTGVSPFTLRNLTKLTYRTLLVTAIRK